MGLLASISNAVFDRGVSRGAPSYFGSQTTYLAGPLYLDAFNAKRAPSPFELVEAYKSLIYACAQINWLGVTRVPLRLYVDTDRGTKPKDVAGPRSISRSMFNYLQRSGYVQRTNAGKDDVHEITNHPLVEALDHPDSEGYFSREDVLGLISAYCDIVGVAYLKLDPPGRRTPPSHLWPIQAQYVYDIKKSGTPLLDYYRYWGDQIDPQDMLRFRIQLSLRDPYGRGYSPTYAALQYAMLEDKYVAVQDQLLGQGPRPQLLISPKDGSFPMGEAERQRFDQDLTRKLARGGAGKALITDGAIDVNTLSYSPTDLAGLTLSEYDLERTCNCFGIPVAYFTKDTNLANLQAAESQHSRFAIEPRHKAIAGTLTRLARRYDDRLFFAFDPCIEEDKEQAAKIAQIHLQTGLTTINEELAEMPYPEKEWGDEPWLPGTLKQPTMLVEAHDSGMEQAQAATEQAKNATANDDMPASDAAALKSANGNKDKERSAVGSESFEVRFDAVLAAMERDLGL